MARIHLIAIGGSAMHNLALELQAQGNQVSGSDDHFFEPSKGRLKAASLLPDEEGWFPGRISSDIDLIILGMHAQKDNPELARAQLLGLVIMSYPEYLYEQSKGCTRVVVAGSHGKTSITSMVLHVMQQVGQSVNYLVGAQIDGFDRMVRLDPDADFIVIEGDEYGSSPLDPQPKFLWYKPHIALISGIAWDHANIFPSEEGYKTQFAAFIRTIEDSGTLLYCSEDRDLEALVHAEEASIRTVPYATPGSKPAEEGCLLLTPEGEVPLRIFGGHNMQNLEGARLICNRLGVMDDEFYEAITSFTGASKRLERVAENESGLYFRDFAHAPSKVRATVKAVREQYPNRQLIALLELHTYSSLNPDFLPQYAGSLDAADQAMVTFDPEVVRQKRLPELNSQLLTDHFQRGDLQVITESDQLPLELDRYRNENAVFLLMSSGNFAGQILF